MVINQLGLLNCQYPAADHKDAAFSPFVYVFLSEQRSKAHLAGLKASPFMLERGLSTSWPITLTSLKIVSALVAGGECEEGGGGDAYWLSTSLRPPHRPLLKSQGSIKRSPAL